MIPQIVLWTRADGLRCLGQKNPPHWHDPKRWELQVWRGPRLIKTERFTSGRRAVTAALTLWRLDFGLDSRPTTRATFR